MKRVLVTIQKGPNYVFHLAALAGAGFRSEYTDAYRHTVSPEDLETLTKYSSRINFGFGSDHGGDLAGLLVFEPAYLNMESVREVREYFDLLDQAFRTGDYSDFLDRYRVAHAELKDFMFHVDKCWLKGFEASAAAIRELGQVYVRSFYTYDMKVYPLEAAKMAGTASKLNQFFRERDIIGKWEEVTGFTWKYPGYEIILCSALKGGPNANSLGYQKNTFYYGYDFDWTTDFISHEVGTHILISVMNEVNSSKAYDQYLVYRAYEDLARFYNFKVLGRDTLYGIGPQYHCDEFQAIYSEIAVNEPGISPAALLAKGIETFRARYPGVI